MEDELRFHLEMQAEDNLRIGMDPAEARYDAMRRFGAMQSVKEEYRENRTFAAIETLFRDIRYALRTLIETPGFTAVAVMTLALGIGANATVFTVTKAALFAGFPLVDRNDRILYITSREQGCCVSYPDFEDWRAQAKSFEGMGVVHGVRKILGDTSGFTASYDVTEVSANAFQLVGRRPAIGRDFAPSDEIPGAAPVAILSYGFWESRYGKDPAIVGRTVRLNGAPTTVIGVMPQGFSFPQKQDLWMPLTPTPEVRKRDARNLWFAFGRMADGVTVESARAEMATIGSRLESAYPLTDRGQPPVVQNFNGFFIGPSESIIYASMWGAVGFVLLIACANLANLMLARAIGRSREISIRIALGAGQWRIVRQLLIESGMLSGVGAVLGWWIAKWGVRAWSLAERGPGRSPWRILDYTMDYRVLWYLIAISIGTALLFGLAPARRLSKLDVNGTLKDGARGATGGGRGKHLSSLLVTGEMALAIVLLAGAGMTIRSFLNIYTADTGVKTANILTMNLEPPVARYPRAEARISFFDRLKTRLEAIPGVESVAIADVLPTFRTRRFPYELAGVPPSSSREGERRPTLSALTIGPGYFRTLGAALLSGREFNDADGVSGVPMALVNQRFAARFWPGEDPLGKRFRLFDAKTPGAWMTVVGVVPNIVQNDATRQKFDPLVYLPYRQNPAGSMDVIARTGVPPGALATAFRREVQAMDSDLPIFGPLPLDARLEGNYWSSGLYAVPFLIFAAIALLLASAGLYAVIAYSVSRRTQEIGIRMALGATARDILKPVFRQGMLPVGIGLAIGLAASFAVNRILKAELVGASASDPVTSLVASAVRVLCAALGCWMPARRAMRVDPAIALRHD